ncbi:DUF4266 domain-containing protein [Pseudoduganella sp. LjRoot289]|uniref:DUF4266 domain-containing protein n=1 Tax=Pseudoduganella sp. LjRoot289 TaxID=3342314 RepID=UPI003ECC539F
MKQSMKWLAAVACVPVLAALGGCAITKVDATERGNLAKEVMQRDSGSQHVALEQHMSASKESTAGGYSVGGGGCGCN